ncbi:hypothetical protein TrST_g14315 [Triparma strigata]|uniref:Uncharacterized protein n=1 Tax=Triparma strigata TaxID=1606541 RepID=A0A9W6ZYD1_9STRA|nr:hypothetical protein TrST_g14315 [Triparma strigata]
MYLPPVKIFLTVLNSFLLCLLINLLYRHSKLGHHKSSWSYIFLLTSLSWVLLREGFFLCTLTTPSKWTSTQFYILYWLPSPLQFSSFMILPLFYAEIFHRKSNFVYKWFIRPFFIAVEVGMVAYMVAWSWIESQLEAEEFECASQHKKRYKHHNLHSTHTHHPNNYRNLRSKHHTYDYYYTEPTDDDMTFNDDDGVSPSTPRSCVKYDYSSSSFRVMTSISFFVLAVVLSVYTSLVRRKFSGSTPRRRRLNKLKTMGRFNDWMLVTVFLSRSIYHLLLLLSYISLPEMSLKRGTDLNFSIGLIFVMWDYVPTFCVLWKMNGRERAENRRRHRRRPSENQRIARKKGSSSSQPLIPPYSSRLSRPAFPDYGVFSMIQENSTLNNSLAKITPLPSSAKEHFLGGGAGQGSLSSLESSFDGRGGRWGSYNHQHGLAYTGGFGSLRSNGGVGSIGSGVGESSVEGDRGWPVGRGMPPKGIEQQKQERSQRPQEQTDKPFI